MACILLDYESITGIGGFVYKCDRLHGKIEVIVSRTIF